MIRILFFIENFSGGGAEKVLCNLVNAMDQSKFDITVQSIWPSPEGKLLNPGVRYRSVYPVRNSLTKKLYRLEAAMGWTYPLHIKDHYDIECAYLEFGSTKIISSSNNRNAVKLAWVHCDLEKSIASRESIEKKCGQWYKKFDKVVCVSEQVKASFDRIFQNRFPSVVLRNYIDTETIVARSQEPIAAQKPIGKLLLLAVGTLYPPKNYPRLLRSVQRLIEDGSKVELWILGDGEQRSMLEAFVAEHGLSESVRFWGFQKNPYPFFRLADLLVCSSNYEGFSTVISEGLILGKPIVTTECSGMRELLGDSEYGLITDNSDEAFTHGLKRMIEDTDRRNDYAKNAAHRADAILGAQLLKKTETFFEDTLASK